MTSKYHFQSLRDTLDVVIASGQKLSTVIDCGGLALVGLRIPAVMTGTLFTFKESASLTGTFLDVYNTSGAQIMTPITASKTILFSPADLIGLRFIKLVSSSNEAADRTVTCLLRAV